MLNKRVTHKSVSAYEVFVHNIMEKSGIILTFCVGVEKLPIQKYWWWTVEKSY